MIAAAANALDSCLAWYRQDPGTQIDRDQYCPTRDVFEGRLSRVLRLCEQSSHSADETALLVAVLGEIGNNAFDHNLGHWANDPGCFFACFVDREAGAFGWVADHGRSVLGSLRQVAPELGDHQTALEMAFATVISGRHPERRGNGLKFVRRVINAHGGRGLVAVSGTGKVCFGGLSHSLDSVRSWPLRDDLGTLAVVQWRFS